MILPTPNVRYSVTPFDDIRLKLNTACNWKCHFCHQEGNPTAGNLLWTPSLETLLDALKSKLAVRTVHLTGGEPTLHPAVLDFIARLRARDFEVRMTSNGTFPNSLLTRLHAAGLSSLNVSVLARDPKFLAALHSVPKTEQWAQRQIDLATQNLLSARKTGLKIHINSTVSRTNDHWREVFAFGKQNGIAVRFQNDLSEHGSDALSALQLIVQETGGRLVEVRRKRFTSRVTYVFDDPSGYQFAVKAIVPTEFPPICGNCLKRAECKEWFYTLRLEQGFPVDVRFCLHRDDQEAVLPAQQFLTSEHFKELTRMVRAAAAEVATLERSVVPSFEELIHA